MKTEKKENVAISVVLPTYNRARCLYRSIRSVLDQTFSNLELIIVDDGSTDNTRGLVESIPDHRIRYIYQDNAGACAARNRGIDEAMGDYIAFQDSDDEWVKNKLEIQLNALISNNADIVFSSFMQKMEGEDEFVLIPAKERKPKGFATYLDLIPDNICTTATILMKRECLIEDRFDISMPRLQEWELMLRLFPKWRAFYVDECLVTVNIQYDSISQNNEALLEALLRVNNAIGTKCKQEITEIYSSTSWKITKPLRALGNFLHKFLGY